MADVILPEVLCSSAEEFLQALSPLGEYFKDQEINAPWLFRGQGQDKDWPLIPSLFRKAPAAKEMLKSFTKRNLDDYSELLLVERDLVVQFFEIADRRGLIIPDDSQELRVFFEKLKGSDDRVCQGDSGYRVKDRASSLMALAQHYGVPTRLLDWTRQPYIAAFFAAESAEKLLDDRKCDFAECLVVWAFYFPDLGRQDDEVRKYAPISVVTAPKATNTNMKAQQGVFTLLNTTYLRDFTSPEYYGEESWLYRLIANPEMKYLKDTKGDYPPLDVFLNNLALAEYPLCVDLVYDSNVKRLISNCRFQKFTLPISEAPQLLHLLAKFDITPSVVYPGYHSISSDLKIQNYWE